jgi:hypothetical protein
VHKKTFDKPVVIDTEAEAAEKAFLIRKKHGILALKMLEISVSTSRKFILDIWLSISY